MTRCAVAIATVGALTTPALAHLGDIDLSVIPPGTSQLLPDTETNPVTDGTVGPLLPMHTMSVHNTQVFKAGQKWPHILMFHRHSAYTADELVNPDVIHFLIDHPNPTTGVTALGSSATQFNSGFRRSFNQLCYGGYNIIHDVSQSVPTRITVDQTLELTQYWDLNHKDAFRFRFGAPQHSAALLNNGDAEINLPAFKNMGYSKGLYYDMYCPGFSVMEDGRAVFMGGHDLNSQNGMYRIQVFDPDLEDWAPRPISCMRATYGSNPEDPYMEKYYGEYWNSLKAQGLTALQQDAALQKFFISKAILNDPKYGGFGPVAQTQWVTTDLDQTNDAFAGDCDPHNLEGVVNDTAYQGLDKFYSATYPTIRLQGPDGTVTQPGRISSDMRYARWYPTQISLPGNKILIYAGWDRDEKNPATNSATSPTGLYNANTQAMTPFITAEDANPADKIYDDPPIPATAWLAGNLKSSGDTAFGNSRVKIPVPEVYDGLTDSTIALENMRLFHGAWYPNGLVIQTGTGRDDWKVAANDGNWFPAMSGGVNNATSDRTFHNSFIYDVQAALKDPNRNTPPADEVVPEGGTPTYANEMKYVTKVGDSTNSHTSFTGNSSQVILDAKGNVLSHKLTHFGGQNGTTGTTTSDIEQIDYGKLYNTAKVKKGQSAPLPSAENMPKWKVLGDAVTWGFANDPCRMYQRGRQNYAVPLPDGTVVLLGGNGGTLPGIEAWSLNLQHYIPLDSFSPLRMTEKMEMGSGMPDMQPQDIMEKLAKTWVPRDEHGIIQLMPDGTVYIGGQNRNGMIKAGDPGAPLGDSDLGVPCGQIFTPPYLYDPDTGGMAKRPLILGAPDQVDYGKPFKVSYMSDKKIVSVAFCRIGAMSHSLSTDSRYIRTAFKAGKIGKNNMGSVTVYPPKLPGTAIGGYYYLFIVDEAGVPSISKTLVLGTEVEKRIKALIKAGPANGGLPKDYLSKK